MRTTATLTKRYAVAIWCHILFSNRLPFICIIIIISDLQFLALKIIISPRTSLFGTYFALLFCFELRFVNVAMNSSLLNSAMVYDMSRGSSCLFSLVSIANKRMIMIIIYKIVLLLFFLN